MITGSDFTSAQSKPTEPGFYICLFERFNRKFFLFGEYAPKTKGENFIVDDERFKGSVLLAWVQIETAENVAEQLNKQQNDEVAG